jgi:hypothetical protein
VVGAGILGNGLASFLLLGLVRLWGMVFPRWTLWPAGRRAPGSCRSHRSDEGSARGPELIAAVLHVVRKNPVEWAFVFKHRKPIVEVLKKPIRSVL